MVYAQMADGCGLDQWDTNSQCVHATAPSVMGPYTDVEVVMPVFCHNPTLHQAADGTYLIYHIGTFNNNATVENCTTTSGSRRSGGDSGALGGGNIGYIGMHVAQSLNGPWTELGPVLSPDSSGWDTLVTNPGAWPQPDGSVLLAYRGKNSAGVELLGMASAPHWAGPYTRVTDSPILPTTTGEDPFIWTDSAGNYHILFHNFNSSAVGSHAFSPAGGGLKTWYFDAAAPPAYTLSVPWVNGSTTSVARRERPQVLFNATSGAMLALSNGVMPSNANDGSFTMLVAFK
jgi:hypothetical protein